MNSFSSVLSSTRRAGHIGLCALLLMLGHAGVASAQEPETAPAPERAVTQAPSNSYVLEGLIFAVLCGAALYAVCRSSPRGN